MYTVFMGVWLPKNRLSLRNSPTDKRTKYLSACDQPDAKPVRSLCRRDCAAAWDHSSRLKRFIHRKRPSTILFARVSPGTGSSTRKRVPSDSSRSWMAALPGSPWKNGYAESFNGKLRGEFLNHVIVIRLSRRKCSSSDGEGNITRFGPTAHWVISRQHRRRVIFGVARFRNAVGERLPWKAHRRCSL